MGQEPTTEEGLRAEVSRLKQRVAELEELVAARDGAQRELTGGGIPWRAIVQSSPNHVMLLEPDGTILGINRTVPDLSVEEVLGRSCLDIASPGFREVASACLQHVAKTRCPAGYQTEYETQEGEVRCFDVRVSPLIEAGEVTALISCSSDVTDREQAVAELEKKKAELETVFKALPDLHFRVDAEGHIVDYHAGTLSSLYLPPEHFLGKRIEEVMPREVAESLLAAVAQIARGEPMIRVEYSLSMPDGPGHFEARILPLSGDQLIVLVRDVSALKRAEEERLALEAKVLRGQKLESLGVLAGGIAHDFNNLLVGILGNAGLALMDIPPEARAREAIQNIELTAQRAAELARQMLAYSGRGKFVVERVDLREIVEEMLRLLGTSISKKTKLVFDAEGDESLVEVDVTQVRQVVMNLVVNASEALGGSGGKVSIGVGVMDCDQACLAAVYPDGGLAPGPYSYVEVSDDGAGMDAETIAHIFDPFFTTKFTGRGLGLAAVLGIMRGHEGGICVSSEAGAGTTFRVLFPSAAGKPSRPAAKSVQTVRSMEGKVVLLVDDERVVRTVGQRILESYGAEVVTAEDGRKAVEIFETNVGRFDCVLLDLTMPNLDGAETFTLLQKLDPKVRVVVTSGYGEQDLRGRFEMSQLAGFIQKPYEAAALRDVVLAALERGRRP